MSKCEKTKTGGKTVQRKWLATLRGKSVEIEAPSWYVARAQAMAIFNSGQDYLQVVAIGSGEHSIES